MKFERWGWLPLLLALPLLALACNGDGGPAAREITADDLAAMTLTDEEADAVFPGLALVETGSGRLSNDAAIGLDQDPEDERVDIEEYGRIDGYQAQYSRQEEAESRVFIRLSVFESDGGASGYLNDTPEDLARRQLELSELDISDIGDEARGFISASTDPVSIFIVLRVDRVYGFIAAYNVDEDKAPEARALAEAVAEKIEAEIQG